MENAFCQTSLFPYIDTVCTDKETLESLHETLQKKSIFYDDNPKEVLAKLQNSKIIYIHPNSFDQWTDILLFLQEKKPLPIRLIIIAGSDLCLEDEHMEVMSGYFPDTHFWIQNWLGTLPRCELLPLGVNSSQQPALEKKEKLLGISFLLNYVGNEKRECFFYFLEKNPSMQIFFLPRTTYENYCKELSKCYYSTCPMGEGFDTYRFWESLSMQTIPIVKDHEFYDIVQDFFPDLPMIRVKEWDDLLALELQEVEFPDLPYLKNKYWVEKLQSLL